MSHKMKCTWPSCSHTAKDQCRTDWVLRSEAHISARTADADEITALRAEIERLRAALTSIRNRRYKKRDTIDPGNALEAFTRLNREIVEIFDEAEAALKG